MKKILCIVCLLLMVAGTSFAGIINMNGPADGVKSAIVFNYQSLSANSIVWSDPVDISSLKFDDTSSRNKETLTLFLALANSSVAGAADITLTYQLSNDGSGWFMPPAEDAEGSQSLGGTGWLGFGIFGKTAATGFDGGENNRIGQTWEAASVSGGAGPYMVTLSSITTTTISRAKYIRFGANQPIAAGTAVFDLIVSGH